MTSRDYTHEIALDSGDKIIPLRYAIPLLGAFAVGGGLVVRELLAHTKLDHPAPIVTTVSTHGAVAKR